MMHFYLLLALLGAHRKMNGDPLSIILVSRRMGARRRLQSIFVQFFVQSPGDGLRHFKVDLPTDELRVPHKVH